MISDGPAEGFPRCGFKSLVRFQRGIFRPRPEILYAIVAVGMAPFLLNVCACCVVAVINMRLLTYGGDIAVSAYGIIKDCEHVMTTFLPSRTPVPNLYITGQNVNFHGILGVTVTAMQLVKQLTPQ